MHVTMIFRPNHGTIPLPWSVGIKYYDMRKDGATAFTTWRASLPERKTMFVDLGWVHEEASDNHASFLSALLRVLDHEFSHVFEPNMDKGWHGENRAEAFERAGAWARR